MSNFLYKSCRKTNHVAAYIQCCHRSTKPAVKQESSEQLQTALRDFEKLSNIYKRDVKMKPQKPPFVKNLFLGVFDTDLLAFPEALDKEELERLNKFLHPVQFFYQQLSINQGRLNGMSKEFIEGARHLKLFGLQAPQLAGGREFNVTETCRFNETALANTGDVNLVKSEQMGVQALLKLGNEKQMNKYLEPVTSGKIVMAFCLAEGHSSDPSNIQTTAVLSGEYWILNGEKTWVINGGTANLFVVIAQTESIGKRGLKELKPTAFFVDRTSGGVSFKTTKMLGLNQTDISTVMFKDTKVLTENMIGELNEGEEVLTKILPTYRLAAGSACTAISKSLLNKFISHCRETSDQKSNLMETDLIHEKISEIAASTYAMESVTYLTAALMDQYQDQDCEMEAAICKAFSAEHCLKSTLQCMSFLGSPAYMESHWCNELHRNCLSYLMLDEPLDSLKIIIALQGLQYAGIKLQEEISKIRNPMYHATAMFKRMWTHRRHINDNPKLTIGLPNYLHPSVAFTASRLEYCVFRLSFVTENLLGRHGADVITKHMELKRLSDCIIDIYAMTAVLSRASRSYCIGLLYSDYEILLANAFCLKAVERVKENARNIFVGPYNTNDGNYNKIATKLFDVGHYYPEHPLTKNY